jgi:hypothetical protein
MKKTAKKLTFEERKEKLVEQAVSFADKYRECSMFMSDMDIMEFVSDLNEAMEYITKISKAKSTRDAQRYLKAVLDLFDKS